MSGDKVMPKKMDYCGCCKKETPHEVLSSVKNKDGTGGDLKCTKCGSRRLGTIQGFNAELM